MIYQVYPRSFADADGDGLGDLRGITSRLDALADLGIDAIWLSPFMRSPQKDAGYDVSDYCDVDPIFGTLADYDELLAQAHARGIRILADLVPNHSSDQHEWFQAALQAAPGSPERDRYMFRDGLGEHGELPPNNWQSVFGGPAWSRVIEADGQPGQWYLHLFDSSQPDFNWHNREVREEFLRILRFWLDRGTDGFRVDVAHGLIKAEGLPDFTPAEDADSMGDKDQAPYWGQPAVHEVYREWRALLESYPDERVLAAEAWMPTAAETALWVRSDEMHQAFNFPYLMSEWNPVELREVITESLRAFGSVGAPATWVLSNHDVVRHATRLSLGIDNPQGHGIGPRSTGIPERLPALRRAHAATTLMLALPGSAYLYQGEELGLPEVIDIPDEARQDPTFARTLGERYGRDGCRVPIPWEADAPAYGFNSTGESWLPQPAVFGELARDRQVSDPDSTLSLYRRLLAARRELGLGAGSLEWVEAGENVLAFRNGRIEVRANFGSTPVDLPEGASVILSSAPLQDTRLGHDTTVWLERAE